MVVHPQGSLTASLTVEINHKATGYKPAISPGYKPGAPFKSACKLLFLVVYYIIVYFYIRG